MSSSVGFGSWAGMIAVAAVLLGLAFAYYALRRRSSRRQADEERFDDGNGRLAVLESTAVDAERRLLLVRCDNIEHLVMVGGPADLVVENDVRRARAAARPPARPAVGATDSTARADAGQQARSEPTVTRRSEPTQAAEAIAAPDAAAHALVGGDKSERSGPDSKPLQAPPLERKRIDSKAAEDGRPGEAHSPAAPRPTLTAVPAPASQPAVRKEHGQSAPAAPPAGSESRANPLPPPRHDESGEARPARLRPAEPQIGARRDQPAATPRGAPAPASPVGVEHLEPPPRGQPAQHRDAAAAGERRLTAQREPLATSSARSGLPAAEVPWPEPDSVESEIVKALSSDSGTPIRDRQKTSAPQPASAAATKSDPATTLGDLAERLEEALAREVQSANKNRPRTDLNHDVFEFDAGDRPVPEQKAQPSQKERRDAPRVIAPAPDAETRRDRSTAPERAERQEEAPVISLNARRREAVDPLEDEMARLLGELTGDSNRR